MAMTLFLTGSLKQYHMTCKQQCILSGETDAEYEIAAVPNCNLISGTQCVSNVLVLLYEDVHLDTRMFFLDMDIDFSEHGSHQTH